MYKKALKHLEKHSFFDDNEYHEVVPMDEAIKAVKIATEELLLKLDNSNPDAIIELIKNLKLKYIESETN